MVVKHDLQSRSSHWASGKLCLRMDSIQAFIGQTCLWRIESIRHLHERNGWWYTLPKTSGFFHFPSVRLRQWFPVGGTSWSSVGGFFHSGCCLCHPCRKPSLLLFSSCFSLFLSISSGYISPLQCWSTPHLMSLRICSLGFHIALASIGVLGSSLFHRLFWFLFPTLIGNPPGLVWCFFFDERMGGVGLSVILE